WETPPSAAGGASAAPLSWRRGEAATPACASLPARRNKAENVDASRGGASDRTRTDPGAGHLSDCRQGPGGWRRQPPSRQDHDQVRGGAGAKYQPTAAHGEIIRADWRDRP